MNTVTLIGNVYDSDGYAVDATYTVTNYTTGGNILKSGSTVLKQYSTTIDGVRYGDVLFVEFTQTSASRYYRYYLKYDGRNTIVQDVQLVSYDLVNTINVRPMVDSTFNVAAGSSIGTNIYYLYLASSSVLNGTNTMDKYVKVGEFSSSVAVDITFTVGGSYKLCMHTMVGTNSSSVVCTDFEVSYGTVTIEDKGTPGVIYVSTHGGILGGIEILDPSGNIDIVEATGNVETTEVTGDVDAGL